MNVAGYLRFNLTTLCENIEWTDIGGLSFTVSKPEPRKWINFRICAVWIMTATKQYSLIPENKKKFCADKNLFSKQLLSGNNESEYFSGRKTAAGDTVWVINWKTLCEKFSRSGIIVIRTPVLNEYLIGYLWEFMLLNPSLWWRVQ